MIQPIVSVVMSVYNEAEVLPHTINSIRSQENVEFEFIIINDGSTDASLNIIQKAAQLDPRIIVLDQANSGLTEALIKGCEKAQGKYIARQDVGDISLPNRLSTQLAELESDPTLALVSSATRFVGPAAEEIYIVPKSSSEIKQMLSPEREGALIGPPHHGSVMLSRELYFAVGGYREQFKVAQDLDLWSRLIQQGRHKCLNQVLYQASLRPNSISIMKRSLQVQAASLINKMYRLRQAGNGDSQVLADVEHLFRHQEPETKSDEADFYYFLAANLRKTNAAQASKYYKMALRERPTHWKSWLGLLGSKLMP